MKEVNFVFDIFDLLPIQAAGCPCMTITEHLIGIGEYLTIYIPPPR